VRTDAVATLRDQDMPAGEIEDLLTADDPRFVRRLLELHRERLQERLSDELETIGELERSLVGAMSERRPVAGLRAVYAAGWRAS